MKRIKDSLELSASDLVGYLNCRHLSELDRAVVEGALAKPKVRDDPLLQLLWERGSVHEQNYVEHLARNGLEPIRIDGVEITDEAVSQTLAAMKRGVQVIVQGALSHDHWIGRADILCRIEAPSAIGHWSYEVIDTKLARETKAATVLQLCLYSDLLTKAQGLEPEYMYVVAPWSDFELQQYRFADYAAYFRKVKRGLLTALAERDGAETYPDPIEHCDICRWRETCEKRRRRDDHLCLVAGISKLQINELKQRRIPTVKALASMPVPLDWKPDRGAAESYGRIREQARVQVEGREAGEGKFELLPVENGFGLTRLPEPSDGDIFFDLEGDPFVGEHGLEYLFGYLFIDESGEVVYRSEWALSRADEKLVFEDFVDFVMARWEQFPSMHIYHYAPYEPSALKRLMGRYATRQEEIDQMLRAGLFVDLYQVVRRGIRASVESYSIKRLEPFYAFERERGLADANAALAILQANLELNDIPSIADEMGIYLTQVTTRCRIGEMEDYPRNLAEFEACFATEQACREYLCQLRWPEGFRCPRCGHDKAWAVRTALLECAGCGHQASPTAGTIFQDTRQPLQSWFRAMWWLTSQKNGASALGLQRVLGLGSYKTAWTWLHKLRRAMVRPGRDRLSGRVEVDETYLGGLEEGVRGRQTDAKALIVVAAEEDGAGIGRVRIRTIPNASGDSLMAFVGESIEPGSVVHTDGWLGYEPLEGDGYRHEVSYLEGQPARASKLLPRVHRVVSLVKRWILGTHQGAVSHEHLDSYLDEFAFRFNRRKSRSRGKLFYRLVQQAVAVPPAPYKSLVGGTATRATDDHNM